jgi:hypothetical protein
MAGSTIRKQLKEAAYFYRQLTFFLLQKELKAAIPD